MIQPPVPQWPEREWWDGLIRRRDIWVNHNFPGGAMIDSVIGMGEEAGELSHGHLKLKQGIRMDQDHEATIVDSIGDYVIYALGVMSRCGPPDVRAMLEPHHEQDDYLLLQVLEWNGAVAGTMHRMSGDDDRRHMGDLRVAMSNAIHYLSRYAMLRGHDFQEVVELTWAQVEERDWIAYPDTGRPA